jgi:hypothetical protein
MWLCVRSSTNAPVITRSPRIAGGEVTEYSYSSSKLAEPGAQDHLAFLAEVRQGLPSLRVDCDRGDYRACP